MDLHVGEYVELADGSVGYIVRFYDSSDYAGLVRLERKTIEVSITAPEKDKGSLRSIFVYRGDSLSNYFARVGNKKLREAKRTQSNRSTSPEFFSARPSACSRRR